MRIQTHIHQECELNIHPLQEAEKDLFDSQQLKPCIFENKICSFHSFQYESHLG